MPNSIQPQANQPNPAGVFYDEISVSIPPGGAVDFNQEKTWFEVVVIDNDILQCRAFSNSGPQNARLGMTIPLDIPSNTSTLVNPSATLTINATIAYGTGLRPAIDHRIIFSTESGPLPVQFVVPQQVLISNDVVTPGNVTVLTPVGTQYATLTANGILAPVVVGKRVAIRTLNLLCNGSATAFITSLGQNIAFCASPAGSIAVENVAPLLTLLSGDVTLVTGGTGTVVVACSYDYVT